MRRTILVTGFEAYGGRGVNPSAEVVRRLDGLTIGSFQAIGRVLPVALRGLRDRLTALLEELDPAAVLGLGLWPGERLIRVERVAFNLAAFEIPDNEGAFIQEAPLAAGAPAVPSRLPLRHIEQALLDAGIPVRLSTTAGTFLCNATMYTLLMETQRRQSSIPCGFVHLPYLPEQVAEILRTTKEERRLELHQRADLASMSLDLMVRAVQIVLETTARTVLATNG